MIVIRIFYCLASIFDPDHLCVRWTTYDNINGPDRTNYVVIFGPARPLMYPDQISLYIPIAIGGKRARMKTISN